MGFGSLFSAVVKPDKPLLYICDESTHITNIAVCPLSASSTKADQRPPTSIQPFVTILKLQYEGPVIEGENDQEAHKNGKSKNDKPKKQVVSKDDEDSDDDDDDSDFDGLDIEAKEVVIGCFTPNTLQLTTDIYLAPNDQYRFVISGGPDYEIHLLGRYIPDDEDHSPYSDSDYDSDEDDFDLDQLSTDHEEGSEGGRIEELDDDDEMSTQLASSKSAKVKPTAPAQVADKMVKLTSDKKSNKRPLEDKETDADVSMADRTADGAVEGSKLSKAQRKKLKKNKAAESPAAPAANTEAPKKVEAAKASPAAKPAALTTVTLPSGLKIIDTKIGQGADAKAGQSVGMRYIGKLTNGKIFDSNTKGKPFNFTLGKGQVIKGWDEGIKGMKIGGERKLIVPANLAYGKNGAPPDIPPNSTLMFEVKMLSIK